MTVGRPFDLVIAPIGRARFAGRRFVCALGAGGVALDKREGDAATPAGVFHLEAVLYRPDRARAPRVATPIRPISPFDGWCDDEKSAAYNTLVRLPQAASAERLRRADRLYDLIGVLDANRAPIQPGCGSAIFLHVARRPRFPTLGCIAFAEDDLRWILARWRTRSRVIVLSSHAGLLRAPKSADPTRTDVAPMAMAIS